MGKSTSCFKIITCGGDSANKDDLETIESKGSSDKRGWSFRKRSARHRVLSNTVITETTVPTFGNKEGSESANVNFGAPADNSAQEKISVVHCSDEKPQLITTVKAEVPDAVVTAESDNETGNEKETGNENETENEQETGNENETDAKIEESVVIAIQTAVRGFLAQRALLKLKNVVKLQAAVRGHIVRRHAVGTLRCVQAIVKMQALVRARHARLSLEGSRQKSDGKKQENAVNKSSGLKASTEKLHSNRFAHQLLESTPKAKRINVKCDPSKPDSAWKWLERWMSVSLVNAAESKKIAVTEHQEGKKKENSESLLGTNVESEIICESVDSKSSSVHESAVPSESEDNLITYEADKFEFQAYPSTTSSILDNLEQPRIENTSTPYVKESSAETNSLQNQETQPDVDCQAEHKPLSEEPEQPKRSMKRLASEELEMESEAKKFVCGSKKTSNPSFIAAQSKFEELSSAVNPGRMMNSSYQESGDESHKDISFETQSIIRTKEIGIAESPVHGSRIQLGGSECGTELSVTSTLDSPDRSDIGAIEHEHEAKASEEGICNPSNDEENLDLEAKDVPTVVESFSSPTLLDQQEKLDVANGEFVSSVVSVDSPQIELKPEKKSYEFQREQQRPETSVQAHVLSPEASPRSHLTVAESQGTPVSQVSAKDRKNKPDKSGSDQKRGSLSATKKSPSNPNHDSGSRNSVEKLPKEQKNGKRRDSFGSTKPENCEQEPQDSSSNSSLPHFMQATESARAKVNANNSPRSSPDVQDREIYIKKRHSLPGAANGRQGSPRIQRSMSQAQQGAKTNERKWQR